MTDKYACKFGPDGRCGNVVVRDDCNLCHVGGRNNISYTINYVACELRAETCPWPSKRKPAPPRRTNRDKAHDAIGKSPEGESSVTAVLRAFGIDPEGEVSE